MPPVLPGRPPPIASRQAFGGVLGLSCDDVLGADDRWYSDRLLSLSPGERQAIMVSSPDFAPRLQILDQAGAVVAEAEGRADGAVAGFIFAAAGEASPLFLPPVVYRLRVTSAEPGVGGSWKVEKNHDGSLEPFSRAHAFPTRTGCRPLGPILPN